MGRAKAYRYKGGSSYSFNKYDKYDKDFVLVDFETPSVPTATDSSTGDVKGLIDFAPGDAFSQKGFVIESFVGGANAAEAEDEILYNNTATASLIPSAIAALDTFGFTGKGGQPNQGLAPNFFAGDLEVIYFEQDKWDEPAEREDFRFKGVYAAGIGISSALAEVTLTFTGYRDGDKEFEFTKTVASGGFIKSDYRDKIDRLVICDNDANKDFVIDNFMAEV
jgi:hypothetical protein